MLATAAVVAIGLFVGNTASADSLTCTDKTSNINGKLGGNSFGFPADTRSLGVGDDDNFIRNQSEDCAQANLNQELDAAASRAAALQVDCDDEGICLTTMFAMPQDGNFDNGAAGATLTFTLDLEQNSWVPKNLSIENFSLSAGASRDFKGDGLFLAGGTVRW